MDEYCNDSRVYELENRIYSLIQDKENLKNQRDELADENNELREKLEKMKALVTALDDIQHYLGLVKDVYYDLNKKDIYRNNF